MPNVDLLATDAVALDFRLLREQSVKRSGYAANKDRKNLAAAWEWGAKFIGLPKNNPFKDVDLFPADKTPRYVPPVKDMDKVLATEKGEVRLFLLTMLHTASRRGALLRMRWDDLDFEAGKVRLWTRKRKGGGLEGDWIPLTRVLAGELERHKATARSVFVFCREDGKPFTNRQHLMERVCKRAEVREFGFHAIRHLTASMLDRDGVELTVIQGILRHKSAKTTAGYLHLLRGMAGAREALEGTMDGKGKVLEMKKPVKAATSAG
jgi:integrase